MKNLYSPKIAVTVLDLIIPAFQQIFVFYIMISALVIMPYLVKKSLHLKISQKDNDECSIHRYLIESSSNCM